MPSIASCSPTTNALPAGSVERVREGTAGRLKNPARSTCPRTSTLRISHFPDPRNRRYAQHRRHGRPPEATPSSTPLDNRREPERRALAHGLDRADSRQRPAA